jgi:hypothetical protein
MREFIQKHPQDTRGVLSGFDRIRFRGTLRTLAVVNMLVRWLSHRHVLLKDFKKFALALTAQLKKSVEAVAAAQALLDAQPWARWSEILQGLLERACPAACQLPAWEGQLEYYWSADETEWASDVMFRSPEALAKLYPLLIRYGISTFSSRDVMRFLGRTRMPRGNGVDLRFNGEVVSDLQYRPEGVRIKHGRRVRGLHLVSGIDAQVGEAVLHGEFAVNGFRNRDLRALLYPPSNDPAERRRQSGKVTRLLRLFVEHGLIYKVKGTHRYHVTAEGRRILPAFVVARNASTEKLQQLAA